MPEARTWPARASSIDTHESPLLTLARELLHKSPGGIGGRMTVVTPILNPHLDIKDDDRRPALNTPIRGDGGLPVIGTVLETAPVEVVLRDGLLDRFRGFLCILLEKIGFP